MFLSQNRATSIFTVKPSWHHFHHERKFWRSIQLKHERNYTFESRYEYMHILPIMIWIANISIKWPYSILSCKNSVSDTILLLKHHLSNSMSSCAICTGASVLKLFVDGVFHLLVRVPETWQHRKAPDSGDIDARQGLFSITQITLPPAWISNHMPSRVWDKITCPFPNSNDAAVEIWKWISNFIPTKMDVITYPFRRIHINKRDDMSHFEQF